MQRTLEGTATTVVLPPQKPVGLHLSQETCAFLNSYKQYICVTIPIKYHVLCNYGLLLLIIDSVTIAFMQLEWGGGGKVFLQQEVH